MNRHAKAPSAGSTTLRGRRPMLLLGVAAALTLLLGVAFAGAAAPTVTIEPAAEVGYTTARAAGEVSPGELETSYHFEYVTEAQFEASEWAEASWTGFGSLPEGINTATAVDPAVLENLTAATTYRVRLFAENADGSEAAATSFTTLTATAPALVVEAATGITSTAAHIAGTLDPEGGNVNPIGPTAVPISWQLQTNREGEGWQLAEAGTIEAAEAEGSSPIAVDADLEGLQPNSEYEFRLLASYAGQEATSAEEEFTTDATAPIIAYPDATPLSATSARIRASLNPRNSPLTDCHFEYSTDTSFGHSVPCAQSLAAIGSGGDPVTVSAVLSGLTPQAVYNFRLVASVSVQGVEGLRPPTA